MNKEKKIPGHILSLFIILLSISGVCLLMYKAQFRFNLHQPIEYVMMTTHKPTGTITLSSDSPVLTETFTCTVPELKMFTLEGTAKNKNSDARLFITLANADSGEIYYQAEHALSVFRATKKKELTCDLKNRPWFRSLTTIQTAIQILFIPSLTATIISCFIFILRCV